MSQRTRNIRNAYDIINSRGDLISTIYEREVDTTSTSLSLHGRGFWPAGRQRNENVVALIENFSGSTPPNNPTAGQFWWKRNDQLYVFEPAIGSPSWKTVVPPSSGIGFRISPGNGIKSDPSDGLPVGSPLTTTLSINAGRGFTFSGNSLITNDSEIVHDDLLGFVANEHLDHSNIQLIGGAGFAVGSPTSIIGSVSMNVGAGKGITVGSQVAVNPKVWRTSGNQTVTHIKSFTGQLQGNGTTASASVPTYAFDGDSNTGMYYISGRSNEISFTTGAVQRFRIESNGVLRSLNTSYESLLSNPHDIPNKKYVDDVIGSSANPTTNTFVGTSSISGLTANATYLVHVYGRLTSKGTGIATLEAIRLRRGSTTPGSGTIVAATPSQSINWFDGAGLSSATFICEMSSDTSINGRIEDTGSARAASYMTAIQIAEP